MATPTKLQRRLLIANRGEIALRILKTARRLGYYVVAIYTSIDASSPHVTQSDSSFMVHSYTSIPEILEVITVHGVEYVIPGYGFLSENEDFATAVEKCGAVFVGPSPELLRTFGIKDRARNIASKAGLPIVPGSEIVSSIKEALSEAERIGYPVMLKATAGGGGMGLQICNGPEGLLSSFETVVSRGTTLFSNAGVFLERYYPASRHIEVQIFGNGLGDCVVFGERECSIQRRHQKVIEESPSPFAEARPDLRKKLFETAQLLGSTTRYSSAGTVEYLVDDTTGDFFFLEMNTRLQVEHGITELRFGIDLVELMLEQASKPLDLTYLESIEPQGAAIEARVYAENPSRDYAPSPGLLQNVKFGEGENIRIDTWIQTGSTVSVFYDPMLAKVMGYGSKREGATKTLIKALEETEIQGVVTNLHLLVNVLQSEDFTTGNTTTKLLDNFSYLPQAVEVLSPGAYTTIQDYPGRVGVGFGIPEAGPMDSIHFRLANIIVGNDECTEGLEITLSGPVLKFISAATVAIAGPEVEVSINGDLVPLWTALYVTAGSTVKVGTVSGSGARVYLAIKGGLPNVATYLGCKATSPIIEMGGLQGRPLVAGDFMRLSSDASEFNDFKLPLNLIPAYDTSKVYCLSGPHDSLDFITEAGANMLYKSEWTVSHQAGRVGVRLLGPQIDWARSSGGEGGSHPSNIIDYGYSIGAVNWTGDAAVVFAADSPSMGGFISSNTVARGEHYKLGQLRPGDKFSFVQVTWEQAMELRRRQNNFFRALKGYVQGLHKAEAVQPLDLSIEASASTKSSAILGKCGDVTLRQAGDEYILVEYPQSLDLTVRCNIQAILEALQNEKVPGLKVMQPMACSLLVQYDGLVLTQSGLVDHLRAICKFISSASRPNFLQSRRIRLPMVWDDKANRASIERYMATQRPYASYLPDPIDFIARSNGLKCRDDVLRIALSTSFLVIGVGFFSGTPLALPLNPCSRLTVPKFNPSRTFSPAGGLGIGGSIFCCDPVDAPGGYVNFGRTIPGWDQFSVNKSFGGRPWLFQNFDQLSFYQVEEDEFDKLYILFRAGQYEFDIEETTFDVDAYTKFCESLSSEIAVFKRGQAIGTAKELARERELLSKWEGQENAKDKTVANIDGQEKIQATMHATVYKTIIKKGDIIAFNTVLFVLEAMKMEVSVRAQAELEGLTVHDILVSPGEIVKPGDVLALCH